MALMQIQTVLSFTNLSLGEVHHIAAAHGRGITLLLEQTLQPAYC